MLLCTSLHPCIGVLIRMCQGGQLHLLKTINEVTCFSSESLLAQPGQRVTETCVHSQNLPGYRSDSLLMWLIPEGA